MNWLESMRQIEVLGIMDVMGMKIITRSSGKKKGVDKIAQLALLLRISEYGWKRSKAANLPRYISFKDNSLRNVVSERISRSRILSHIFRPGHTWLRALFGHHHFIACFKPVSSATGRATFGVGFRGVIQEYNGIFPDPRARRFLP